MGSNSGRKSGSSGTSKSRKRVVIGASETTRVRYNKGEPEVHTERKAARKRGEAGARKSGAGQAFARSKREERERRQRVARFRIAGVWVLLAAAVVGLVIGAFALYWSEAFAIGKIDVRGASRLSREQVLQLAAVDPSSTLLRIDTSAVEERISHSPWIASAAVHRRFPDALTITVAERSPAALVYVGKKPWLVASDGTWITTVKRTAELTPTPVVVRDVPGLRAAKGEKTPSAQLQNALGVIAGLSQGLRDTVRVVSAPEIEKTALLTKSDVEVFVGRADDMAKKDEIIRRILTEQRGKVVYINVRTTDRPTWRGLEETP